VSRIIAGSAGGRRIRMPSGAATRPTTDRVREAVFSAVAAWAGTADRRPAEALAGLAFCDLYAGSGAVGLEAASRGADPVLLVERDRRTAGHIRGSAGELGLPVTVRAASVADLLRGPADRPYDVVFADPPYELATPLLEGQLADLVAYGWLGPSALVLLERSRRSPAPAWPPLLTQTWSRAYGETIVYFGARSEEGVPA
jgi:16S rRNA (guanine966-N2)-methyltransferase